MEDQRLQDVNQWRQWGPYLSERQWGTVREDFSIDGHCWDDFSHDQAVYRAYRWGEDGLLGVSDEQCRLCLALSLWNEKDPILKERLYGLTNAQGNHGEDVKELYYYLDNTPTHSYMKALYKYPQTEFPYRKLIEENEHRTVYDREYEIIDTGVFKDKRYFDVLAEYCKASPTDILGRYTVTNHSPEKATIHILPTLWYRNTWSWGPCDAAAGPKPSMYKESDGRITCQHHDAAGSPEHPIPPETSPVSDEKASKRRKGDIDRIYVFEVDTGQNGVAPEIIFTENETNYEKFTCAGKKNEPEYVKDSFHDYVINGNKEAVHRSRGNKCSAHYTYTLEPGQSAVVKIRLCEKAELSPHPTFRKEAFDEVFKQRIQEADEFYNKIAPFPFPEVQRQAFAGLLWSKQFYYLVQKEWIDRKKQTQKDWLEKEKETKSLSREKRDIEKGTLIQKEQSDQTKESVKESTSSKSQEGDKAKIEKTFTIANEDWEHLYNKDIISMPDKWEFPWYAAWDLALQSIVLAKIDVRFAMNQLELLLKDGYMHDDGRLPAYDFNFSDTNPPLHAYAVLKVYKKSQDIAFLDRCFGKLQLNFQWWIEDKSIGDRKLFSGGFLGFDNISVFNRSKAPLKKGFHLAQADATAWIAMFSLNMMEISLILARDKLAKHDMEENELESEIHQDIAISYLEYFLEVAEEMNKVLWNTDDGFYYDHITSTDLAQSKLLQIKSMVGLIALFATSFLRCADIQSLSRITKYLDENRDKLHSSDSCSFQGNGDIFLSLVNKEKLSRIMDYVVNGETFLSTYGVRSLSKEYKQQPYCLSEDEWSLCIDFDSTQQSSHVKQPGYSIEYEPGESRSTIFGGNSNWRGPVWMPVNYLLIDSLRRHGDFYGDNVKVIFPVSGLRCKGKQPSSKNLIKEDHMTLGVVANELGSRLQKLFLPGAGNQRPCHGSDTVYASEPDFQELCLFYEYYHGDTGRGCGASHQTGWTALLCSLFDR